MGICAQKIADLAQHLGQGPVVGDREGHGGQLVLGVDRVGLFGQGKADGFCPGPQPLGHDHGVDSGCGQAQGIPEDGPSQHRGHGPAIPHPLGDAPDQVAHEHGPHVQPGIAQAHHPAHGRGRVVQEFGLGVRVLLIRHQSAHRSQCGGEEIGQQIKAKTQMRPGVGLKGDLGCGHGVGG